MKEISPTKVFSARPNNLSWACTSRGLIRSWAVLVLFAVFAATLGCQTMPFRGEGRSGPEVESPSVGVSSPQESPSELGGGIDESINRAELVRDNARLIEDNARLVGEYKKLLAEYKRLVADFGVLVKDNKALIENNKALMEENAKLMRSYEEMLEDYKTLVKKYEEVFRKLEE